MVVNLLYPEMLLPYLSRLFCALLLVFEFSPLVLFPPLACLNVRPRIVLVGVVLRVLKP